MPERAALDSRGNSDWRRNEVDVRGNSDWKRTGNEARGNSDWRRREVEQVRLTTPSFFVASPDPSIAGMIQHFVSVCPNDSTTWTFFMLLIPILLSVCFLSHLSVYNKFKIVCYLGNSYRESWNTCIVSFAPFITG